MVALCCFLTVYSTTTIAPTHGKPKWHNTTQEEAKERERGEGGGEGERARAGWNGGERAERKARVRADPAGRLPRTPSSTPASSRSPPLHGREGRRERKRRGGRKEREGPLLRASIVALGAVRGAGGGGLVLLVAVGEHFDEDIDVGLDGGGDDGALLGLEGVLGRFGLYAELEGEGRRGGGPAANLREGVSRDEFLVLGLEQHDSVGVDADDDLVGDLSSVVDALARRVEGGAIELRLFHQRQVAQLRLVRRFALVLRVLGEDDGLPFGRLLRREQGLGDVVLEIGPAISLLPPPRKLAQEKCEQCLTTRIDKDQALPRKLARWAESRKRT